MPQPGLARIEPLGVSFEVDADETLMAAAQRQGYSWPTVCGGRAGCAACYVRVLDGAESLSPPSKLERDALLRFRRIDVDESPEVRLACQLVLSGSVTIRKLGVRKCPVNDQCAELSAAADEPP